MSENNLSEYSTSLIWLSNIFESCLIWHEGEILDWKRNKGILAAKLKSERQKGQQSYDRSEYDSALERWCYWEGKTLAYELLLDLYVAVVSNPFPGQVMRLLEVAYALFPDVEGGFMPGEMLRGRGYWRRVFYVFRINLTEAIRFPVEIEKIDIFEVERKLVELLQEGCFVMVKDASKALPWDVRSKVYRTVKCSLEEKGWKWGQMKREGKVNKVIFAPER